MPTDIKSEFVFGGSPARFVAIAKTYQDRAGWDSFHIRTPVAAGEQDRIILQLDGAEVDGNWPDSCNVLVHVNPDGTSTVILALRRGNWMAIEPAWRGFVEWLEASGWIGDVLQLEASAPDPTVGTWEATFDWYYGRLPSWARLDYDAIAREHGVEPDSVRQAHRRYQGRHKT